MKKYSWKKTFEQRFKEKYYIDKNGCWIWTGAKNKLHPKKSYLKPVFWDGERNRNAARYSYEKKHGIADKNLITCHKCDVSICVNPDHIFIGTHKDNMIDLINKGLQVKGEKNGNTKISNDDVICIFKSKDKASLLSKKYNISCATIFNIRNGYTWSHITGLEKKYWTAPKMQLIIKKEGY